MAEGTDVMGHDESERIDLTRDADVAYWCRLFDVDHTQLRQAIQHVGPRAGAVLRYLRKADAGTGAAR